MRYSAASAGSTASAAGLRRSTRGSAASVQSNRHAAVPARAALRRTTGRGCGGGAAENMAGHAAVAARAALRRNGA
uniref:Uncharacterized protein n=1 Tax=Oryza meridionalis TaxID=40149 RepID=A0A0E0ESW7_9ORYZ